MSEGLDFYIHDFTLSCGMEVRPMVFPSIGVINFESLG